MRRAFLFLSLMLGIAAPAFAGKIYGTLTEGGKPVAKDVKVELACGDKKYNAQTDDYGLFRVFAAEKGKCTLKVFYQQQSPSLEINSYDGSVQYDLILEKKDGQYTLRRK